jgi:hypothetical protein
VQDQGLLVAQLAPDGQYRRHASLFSAGGSITNLALGPTGRVLVSGGLQPGTFLLPGGSVVAGAADGSGVFFLELDEAGDFARAFGQACAAGPPILAGSTDVVLVGTFTSPVDFGQGPLAPVGAGDVYVTKLPTLE